MSIFVLTRDREIKKLPITGQVQTDIVQHFRGLVKAYATNHPDPILFNGRYNPDDEESLEIPDFKEGPATINKITNPTGIDDFIVNNNSLFQIRALLVGVEDQNGDPLIAIQKFDKRKIITPSGISLFFSGRDFKRIEGNGLSIDTSLTAILFEQKRLWFRNFFVLKQIFDMSSYYNEATDHEIREFGKLPSIDIPDINNFVKDAKPWVRSKLYTIKASKILQNNTPAILKKVADKMGISFPIKSGKIELPADNKELKKILQFLDEDIYQSPFSSDIWIANSKKKG